MGGAQRTIELVAKMKGLIMEEQAKSRPQIKTLIVNSTRRPPQELQQAQIPRAQMLDRAAELWDKFYRGAMASNRDPLLRAAVQQYETAQTEAPPPAN